MRSPLEILSLLALSVKGNGAIEFLLALPILLLILFASVDAGLSSVEKAAVRDLVRSVLNDEQLLERGSAPYEIGPYGDLVLNEQAVDYRLEQIAENVYRKVFAAKGETLSAEAEDIVVEVSAVELLFDQESGGLDTYSPYRVLRTEIAPSRSLGASRATVPGYPYRERDDYLREVVFSANGSHFNIPLGTAQNPENRGAELQQRSFAQDRILGVYLEVRTRSRGLNSALVESALGRMYATQIQNFHVFRKQFEW